MGIRLHERFLPVNVAGAEIKKLINDQARKHNLTDVETLQILTEFQQSCLKYMLRSERHPDDPERQADEAGD